MYVLYFLFLSWLEHPRLCYVFLVHSFMIKYNDRRRFFYRCSLPSCRFQYAPLNNQRQPEKDRSIESSYDFCWYELRWSHAFSFPIVFSHSRAVIVYSFLSCWAIYFLVLWLERAGFCWSFFHLLIFVFVGCRLLQQHVWNV